MVGTSVPEIEWSILCKKLSETKTTETRNTQLNGYGELAGTIGEGPAITLSVSQGRGVTLGASQRTNMMPII